MTDIIVEVQPWDRGSGPCRVRSCGRESGHGRGIVKNSSAEGLLARGTQTYHCTCAEAQWETIHINDATGNFEEDNVYRYKHYIYFD